MLHLVRTVRTFSLWSCGAQCFLCSWKFYSLTAFTSCTKQIQFSYKFPSLIYWKMFSYKFSQFSFSCSCFSFSFLFCLFFLQQEQLFRCVFCFYHFPEIFFFYFPKKNLSSLKKKNGKINSRLQNFSFFFFLLLIFAKFQVFWNYVLIVCEVIENKD